MCSPSPKVGAGQHPYSTQGTTCPAPGQGRAREEGRKGNQPLGSPCCGPGSERAPAFPFLLAMSPVGVLAPFNTRTWRRRKGQPSVPATQRGKSFTEVRSPGQADSHVQDSGVLVLAQKWGEGSLPVLPPPAWALRGPLKWPPSWPSNAASSPQSHQGLEGNLVPACLMGAHYERGVIGSHSTRTQCTEHLPAEGAGADGASVDIE